MGRKQVFILLTPFFCLSAKSFFFDKLHHFSHFYRAILGCGGVILLFLLPFKPLHIQGLKSSCKPPSLLLNWVAFCMDKTPLAAGSTAVVAAVITTTASTTAIITATASAAAVIATTAAKTATATAYY